MNINTRERTLNRYEIYTGGNQTPPIIVEAEGIRFGDNTGEGMLSLWRKEGDKRIDFAQFRSGTGWRSLGPVQEQDATPEKDDPSDVAGFGVEPPIYPGDLIATRNIEELEGSILREVEAQGYSTTRFKKHHAPLQLILDRMKWHEQQIAMLRAIHAIRDRA